jgi:hypothetical protein
MAEAAEQPQLRALLAVLSDTLAEAVVAVEILVGLARVELVGLAAVTVEIETEILD